MNQQPLLDRRILITGAGSGIGAKTAREVVERGGRIAVFDINGEAAAQTARSLGVGKATSFQGHVTDEAAIEGVLDAMTEAWGGIDDLVNNVGIYDHDPMLELSISQWKRVFEANFMAPIVVSCAAVRRMKPGGSIVNVSSVLGQVSAPGRGPYCVSKAALISLTKMQAIEWAERRIRVNASRLDTSQARKMTNSFNQAASLMTRSADGHHWGDLALRRKLHRAFVSCWTQLKLHT